MSKKITRTVVTGYIYKIYEADGTPVDEIEVSEPLGKREQEQAIKNAGFEKGEAVIALLSAKEELREMSLETFIANSTVVE